MADSNCVADQTEQFRSCRLVHIDPVMSIRSLLQAVIYRTAAAPVEWINTKKARPIEPGFLRMQLGRR